MFQGVLKSINKGINKFIKTTNKYIIKGKEYYEDKLLAEGGFGYVYVVSDTEANEKYALKKINVTDSSQLISIKREIEYWNKVNNHPNIVKMIDFEINESFVLILMELCTEGTLLDMINNRNEKTIIEKHALFIISQVANGIYHMHSQNPPIAHRDIKIENVLKFGTNYKLCDFGSASIDILDTKNETKSNILENFSKFEKSTTFMYRPPEMCDPYSKFFINEKVDIWMLGCVLFTLLFKQHPFQDAQKLTIINAHYYIPEEAKNYSEKIIDFIRLMLTPNPANRPSAKDVINLIINWEHILTLELPSETLEIKMKQLKNVKSNKNDLLTADDIFKAQQAILKEQAKKNKYKKRIEIFDGIQIDKDKPDIDKKNNTKNGYNQGGQSKITQNTFSSNLSNPFEFLDPNTNTNKNQGEWLIDFNKAFDNTNTGSTISVNHEFEFLDNNSKTKNNIDKINNGFYSETKIQPKVEQTNFGEFDFHNNFSSMSNNKIQSFQSNNIDIHKTNNIKSNNIINTQVFNFDNKFNNSNNTAYYNNSMNSNPLNSKNNINNLSRDNQKKVINEKQNIYDFFK